jgi:hypothetical protein
LILPKEIAMTLTYRCIKYAYTPVLGEKPVFSADVEINGRPHHFEKRANDVYEIAHAICAELGMPFQCP